jgi:general secretion pathway protein F
MLVEGGIPLPESLSLANQVLPTALQPGGVAVVTAMRQGLAPSIAYIQAQMATPVAEQLLRAGERSGDVGLMLRRAAEFHENEVSKSLEQAMRVIEPLVMTFIGVGVGVVVILMYLPIFELASAIQ